MMLPHWNLASQVRILAVASSLLLAAPAQAQFYWPWQSRPVPPPPPAAAPPAPAQQRAAPKPAPKPQAAKPSDGKQGEAKTGDKKDEKAEVPDAPPPPYEPQLLRLSEILGALAFLRPLCGGNDAQDWRTKMAQLMEAEATTDPRKERLAGAYNRGYREYAQTYRRCTPAAELVIQRYAEEGGKLTRELTSRFGG